MKPRPLRTSDVAHAVGVHPNTVRLYESWGFLPPVKRGKNGYRRFTQTHVDQLRRVRLALRATWLGGDIRAAALGCIAHGAAGDLEGAYDRANRLRAALQHEIDRAEAAVRALQSWAGAGAAPDDDTRFSIGETAALVDVTRDMLRNWERNGLIDVARDADGDRAYRQADLQRLRIIRTLRQARYSTMAILRMLNQLDRDGSGDLRTLLDTPPPDDDIHYATDQWLSTLSEIAASADTLVALIEQQRATVQYVPVLG